MKKNRQNIRLILPFLQLSLIVFLAFNLNAQTTLQVVTKVIEKSFSAQPILEIEAEKAAIFIEIWDKAEVKVSLELAAKHPDKKIAVTDLEMMKYVIEKIGGKLFLKNYLAVENLKNKPNSNFKAKYTIFLPKNTALNITNSFGKIYAKALTNKLKIKADFCKIELEDITGDVKLNTHYGELFLNEINATLSINTDRSDVMISNLAGESKLNSSFGNINITSLTKPFKKLEITANKADLKLIGPSFKNKNYKYAYPKIGLHKPIKTNDQGFVIKEGCEWKQLLLKAVYFIF